MTAPAWYHADGDPEGTVRYWDGTTWVGDAMQSSASSHAAQPVAVAAPPSEFGDVAVRKTLAQQGAEAAAAGKTYGANTSRPALKRRRLPEGLKNLTILVSTFKAVPLLMMTFGFVQFIASRTIGTAFNRYTPPGLDSTADFAVSALMLGAMLALGSFLIVTQVRAATRDQASVLFSFALILVVLDLANLASQWARFGGAGVPLAIFGMTVLQAIVAAWAFAAQSR